MITGMPEISAVREVRGQTSDVRADASRRQRFTARLACFIGVEAPVQNRKKTASEARTRRKPVALTSDLCPLNSRATELNSYAQKRAENG